MPDTITVAEYKALTDPAPSKYRNRPVYECRGCQQTNDWVHANGSRLSTCPGCGYDSPKRFASQAEWQRWRVLVAMEAAGEIFNLRRQYSWPLIVKGIHIATYRDDFNYLPPGEGRRVRVVEDVKGVKTPAYRMKRALMLACWGITITEVNA